MAHNGPMTYTEATEALRNVCQALDPQALGITTVLDDVFDTMQAMAEVIGALCSDIDGANAPDMLGGYLDDLTEHNPALQDLGLTPLETVGRC